MRSSMLLAESGENVGHTWEILGIIWWQWLIAAVLVMVLVRKTFFVVRQQTAAIVERFGRFHAVKHAGLRVKIPFIDRIAEYIDLQLIQMNIKVETKTKDNVFLHVVLAVQYRVDKTVDHRIADAFYALDDETEQIRAFVVAQVRAILPGMNLDDAFADSTTIAEQVKRVLADRMSQYGYIIEDVLTDQIIPDAVVVDAMNRINAAQRDSEAAKARGEAERILAVKRGEGVGGERLAVVRSYAEAIKVLSETPGVDSDEAGRLFTLVMHYDAIRAAAEGPATTILLPTDGRTAVEQIMTGVVAGNAGAPTPVEPARAGQHASD